MSNEMSHPEREYTCPEGGCEFRLEVHGGFLLLMSLTGFLCGSEALAAAVTAAAAHELGHLILILMQGGLPRRLILDVSGACLFCAGREPDARQELIRASAGPAAGLILWLALRFSGNGFLRTAANVSLMLSLTNLLPASGLDGDRILCCLLSRVLTADGCERISVLLGMLSTMAAVILGILHSPQLFLYGIWLSLRQLRIRLRN
jgi:Zn-dependent protease